MWIVSWIPQLSSLWESPLFILPQTATNWQHLFWRSAKCRLQSRKFAGCLQTKITIEINCSKRVTEHRCKRRNIAESQFSSKQVQPMGFTSALWNFFISGVERGESKKSKSTISKLVARFYSSKIARHDNAHFQTPNLPLTQKVSLFCSFVIYNSVSLCWEHWQLQVICHPLEDTDPNQHNLWWHLAFNAGNKLCQHCNGAVDTHNSGIHNSQSPLSPFPVKLDPCPTIFGSSKISIVVSNRLWMKWIIQD